MGNGFACRIAADSGGSGGDADRRSRRVRPLAEGRLGRMRRSRNRASLLAQEVLDASAAILTNKIIERAIAGDAVALRFCLARILAPRRAPPIELELPPLDTQQDLALAVAAASSLSDLRREGS